MTPKVEFSKYSIDIPHVVNFILNNVSLIKVKSMQEKYAK